MPLFTVDRFEGQAWVVLEDERALSRTVPRSWVPVGTHEGDVLSSVDELPTEASETVRLSLDPAATTARRKGAQEQRNRLIRGPQGDIRL
jgi:hypothetical protein